MSVRVKPSWKKMRFTFPFMAVVCPKQWTRRRRYLLINTFNGITFYCVRLHLSQSLTAQAGKLPRHTEHEIRTVRERLPEAHPTAHLLSAIRFLPARSLHIGMLVVCCMVYAGPGVKDDTNYVDQVSSNGGSYPTD